MEDNNAAIDQLLVSIVYFNRAVHAAIQQAIKDGLPLLILTNRVRLTPRELEMAQRSQQETKG